MFAAASARLPYPVAAALLRLSAAGDEPADQLRHLLFSAESLLQLLGTALVLDASEALRGGRGGAALGAEFGRVKLAQGGLGLWCHCLRTLRPREPLLRELAALWRDPAALEGVLRAAALMAEERNQLSHPVREPSQTEAERRLRGLRPALTTLVTALGFLGDYHLLTVDRCRNERRARFRLRVRSAMGPHASQPPFSIEGTVPLNEGDVVLLRLDHAADEALILSPLYQVVGPPDDFSKSLFAFRRADGRRLRLYGVTDPDENHEIELPGAGDLRAFLQDAGGRALRGTLGLTAESREALRNGLRPQSGATPVSVTPPGPPPAPPEATALPGAAAPPVEARPTLVLQRPAPPATAVPQRPALPPEAPPHPPRPGARRRWARWLLGAPLGAGLLLVGLQDGLRALLQPRSDGLASQQASSPSSSPGPSGSEPATPEAPGIAVASAAAPSAGGTAGAVSKPAEAGPAAPELAAAPPVEGPRAEETNWTLLPTNTDADLRDIWAGEDGRLLAVGARGAVLLRGAGPQAGAEARPEAPRLRPVPGAPDLFGACGGDGPLMIAGAPGRIGRSVDGGASWSWPRSGTAAPLTAVLCRGAEEVFVAGESGILLRSQDGGQSFARLRSGVPVTLRALRGEGATLLAAGWDGLVLQHDGRAGRLLPTGRSEWLWDLFPSESGLFVVGQRGLALRLPGAAAGAGGARTQALPTGTQNDLKGVFVAGPAVYVVGDGGLVLRSDDRGGSWRRDGGGALGGIKTRLHRITGTGRGDLYIVGAGGVLLHRRVRGGG